MKLSEIQTDELLDILRATEKTAGVKSVEAAIIRREVIRRANRDQQKPANITLTKQGDQK
ncbi:MAG: hypothetical protein GXY58_12250 [Planctomycetaceae bacterium]|nr:hypothetical protein [Planctomycetaceae bacterium]